MNENTISTGVDGLDAVLFGGLPQGASVILEGTPGSGKTTMAFQFLHRGATVDGESGLYITFEELPTQMYADMAHFGWDLRELEKRNQLRVLSLSPETLIEQMLEPGGLFDQIVDELDCKRVVIDSVSLLQYGTYGYEEHRKMIYKVRNVLRKKGLTSLLIREQSEVHTNQVPFEHFVADGVIRLTVKSQLERYRERILEVLKMRGAKFLEGEHVYRITDSGIYLIPALHIMNEPLESNGVTQCPTSIPKLDKILGGGIPNGSVFMFDTNSKSDYKHLFGAIVAAQLRQGCKGIILPSTNLNTVEELYEMHDVDVRALIESQSLFFIEHYQRPYPEDFKPAVVDVSKIDNQAFNDRIQDYFGPIIRPSVARGEQWFVYYDMNTVLSERGKDFVTTYFAQEAARARANGITLLVLCNFKEIGESVASFLERSSDGVIRTWVDRTYQYLQVNKLPDGHVSDIQIVERIPEKPYIRLV